MSKILTVAILGLGSRGADSYGKIINKDPRFNIVAICDIRKKYKVDYGVDKYLPDKDDVFEKLDELREDKTIKE